MEYNYSKSRLTKKEEQKAYRKIFLAITGSILLFFVIIFYGIPALINMAVFISNLKGEGDIVTNTSSTVIVPPSLEIPYEATNTANIKIKGSGQAGTTVDLFVNGDSYKRLVIPKDNSFIFDSVILNVGENKVWAISENPQHQKSGRSDIFSIIYKKEPPKVELKEPEDEAKISNDSKTVYISGQTEEDVQISLNDRIVIVDPKGSFSYTLPLNDGDNKITLIATDIAGNITKIERKVTYQAP